MPLAQSCALRTRDSRRDLSRCISLCCCATPCCGRSLDVANFCAHPAFPARRARDLRLPVYAVAAARWLCTCVAHLFRCIVLLAQASAHIGRRLTIRSSRTCFVTAKAWQKSLPRFCLHYASRLNSGVSYHWGKGHGGVLGSRSANYLSHRYNVHFLPRPSFRRVCL